jgi:endonuclease YncB( thermonuclease family)
MAWVADQSVEDRELVQLQEEAQAAKRGLWSYESPIPPWEWHSRGMAFPGELVWPFNGKMRI